MPRSRDDHDLSGPMLDEAIRRAPWAGDLRPEQIARVVSETHERTIASGSFVARQGDPPGHWLGVLNGLVKLSRASPAGRVVTFTGIASGGWIGESALLRNERRRADIVAVRTSRIALMPREIFLWLLEGSIVFNRFVLHQLNERLGQYFSLVESDRVQDSVTRIAHCIAALFDPFLNPGMEADLQLSQQEIGFLCGASRQRTNEALHSLEDLGLVKIGYGCVRVVDLDGLRGYGDGVTPLCARPAAGGRTQPVQGGLRDA